MRQDERAREFALSAAWDAFHTASVMRSAVDAAIDAYLSKMPRAWAMKTEAGVAPYQVYADKPSRDELVQFADGQDFEIVPVAIVELKEGG